MSMQTEHLFDDDLAELLADIAGGEPDEWTAELALTRRLFAPLLETDRRAHLVAERRPAHADPARYLAGGAA